MSSHSPAKQERNSSVEALRIVAMAMIVLSHSSVHGGFPEMDSRVSFNNYLLDWLVLGNLGVDIFVMISGYFLSTREFKVRSVFKLLAQVWFFSYLCIAVYVLTGNSVSFKHIVSAVIPTITDEYWFFTAYFVMLLLSSYINIFIRNATRKQMLSCLTIMVILWSVVPTFTLQTMQGSTLLQFIMFYLMGAYLKKYPDNAWSIPTFRGILMAGSAVLLFASSVVLRLLKAGSETKFYERSSILVIVLAVGMVAAAVYRRPWSNKVVNAVSSCTFGVYLFHDNPLIRSVIWPDWINNDAFYDSGLLIVRIVLSAVIVFAVGTVIEFLRQKIFAGPMQFLIEKGYAVVQKASRFAIGKASGLVVRLRAGGQNQNSR